ncbi:hypothetical protein R69749_01237 [Paraburkholderia domus]|uniref:Uncharacterized protein n=1 Tax=Paraburkholderia domus TaxID=2793075 RepID=A0A9N8QSP6_9BURK|nr:hypothetical protein R69749_01237 [Paraburkholderia domus]CAE6855638.1 hypothetical protein R70199_00569 [Paraburkholderia domus]CAE6867397.1 hypothetical protein R70211_00915 [Paraburkholderia domus]CAE6871878.1 hypothetical protein R75471_01005 [Paraburkholderia domus]
MSIQAIGQSAVQALRKFSLMLGIAAPDRRRLYSYNAPANDSHGTSSRRM